MKFDTFFHGLLRKRVMGTLDLGQGSAPRSARKKPKNFKIINKDYLIKLEINF
jgi:hypothetical protein